MKRVKRFKNSLEQSLSEEKGGGTCQLLYQEYINVLTTYEEKKELSLFMEELARKQKD